MSGADGRADRPATDSSVASTTTSGPGRTRSATDPEGADDRVPDGADPADGPPPVTARTDGAAIGDGPGDALLDDGVGASTGSDDVLATRLRWVRRIAWIASVCVALGLFAYSVHIYRRFDLTTDFAIPNQAWSQIAHGHLNPYSTLNPYYYPHYGYSFWQDHFELIFWPLALLWFLYPHSIDLLLVQDVGLAGSILVATLFLVDLIEQRWAGRRHTRESSRVPVGLAVGGLVALVVNPWIYWSASFDFHLEALATLFLLLAARDLWSGRNRRALVWVVLVLLCGNVSATYLFALGICALLARRDLRLKGVGLMALGLVWAEVVGAIGGGTGTLIAANYGYLAHPAAGQTPGNLSIVTGALLHPSTPLHMLSSRSANIYRILAPSGVIGVATPLGFGVTFVVMLSNELNASPVFSVPISSFQNLPMCFFVLIGSVELLAWFCTRRARAWRWIAVVVGVGLLVQCVVLAAVWIPRARTTFLVIDGPTAAALARVEPGIPAGDEVVASQGVVGRFGNRQYVYPFLDLNGGGQVIPLHGVPVTFVLTAQGIEYATAADTATAVARLEALGARRIPAGPGVVALRWTPPAGAAYVTIPPTAAARP
jgi:uncharacterized membrane protein (DUF485 family)